MSAAGKMRALALRLDAVPVRMAPAAATDITSLWRASYAGGRDPYGNAWAPLAKSTVQSKGGDARILRDTDETYGQTRALPSAGAGVYLATGDNAAWHQEEHGSRPARPVMPARGLPPTWLAALRSRGFVTARLAVRP